MSKELTPLEALESIKFGCCSFENRPLYQDEYKIVETALKDYERLKSLKLLPYPQEKGKEYRQDVVKRLSALEIIKEKKVNVGLLLRCDSVERYNKGICYEPKHLTQDEYDLLREVLTDEK